MWDKAVINMILVGIGETLYMTLASTIMGYVFGMPLELHWQLQTRQASDPMQ